MIWLSVVFSTFSIYTRGEKPWQQFCGRCALIKLFNVFVLIKRNRIPISVDSSTIYIFIFNRSMFDKKFYCTSSAFQFFVPFDQRYIFTEILEKRTVLYLEQLSTYTQFRFINQARMARKCAFALLFEYIAPHNEASKCLRTQQNIFTNTDILDFIVWIVFMNYLSMPHSSVLLFCVSV